LATWLVGGTVVLLDGELGAGKTRFVQGVAQGLGIAGPVTSPTLNLVLEYPLSAGAALTPQINGAALSPLNNGAASASLPTMRLLRHFDLYRLEHAEQLDDLDYFGLIEEQDAVSMVEWGDRFASYLPLEYILIRIIIAEDDPDKRLFELSAEGARFQELLERFMQAVAVESQDHE